MAVVCHYAIFNIASVIYLTCAVGKRGGGGQEAHVYATFNNVSVIYLTCAVGRGFKRLMLYATFNIVSFIYHTSAVCKGGR